MHGSTRNSQRRQAWLAIAAVLGLTASGLAQSWDGSTPPNAFTPPTSTSTDLEAKAAVAANRGEIQPAGYMPPPPRTAAAAIPVRAPATAPVLGSTAQPPVWNVAPTGSRVAELPNYGERSAHEFGTGWKNFVNQKVIGVPASPAAALVRPRITAATPTARMEWNWQGYDTYNHRGGEVVTGGATAQNGMHPDMAPYMKYAHLWRSSNNGFAQPVLLNADPVASGPALSQGRSPSAWHGSSASSGSKFAVTEPERSPIQPTNFATTSSPDALPLRPVQFPAPNSSRSDESLNGVPRLVRESIADACMNKARNVMVELVAPMRLRVAFRVREQADAEMLTEKLSRLRDLAPYKVDFEVQIGQ